MGWPRLLSVSDIFHAKKISDKNVQNVPFPLGRNVQKRNNKGTSILNTLAFSVMKCKNIGI
jgi:hypothetical protein